MSCPAEPRPTPPRRWAALGNGRLVTAGMNPAKEPPQDPVSIVGIVNAGHEGPSIARR
jgi:hypothetical protein